MSKAIDTIVVEAMVSKVTGSISHFEKSGTSQKRVQIDFASGRRAFINEGMLAFANACHFRPGDIVSFNITGIKEGSFIMGKDTENERTIKTEEYVGIGEMKVVAIGQWSDTPDELLVKAGRTCVNFEERTIKAKNPTPPVAPPVTDTASTVAGESPFQQEAH